jgi:hypothetical protein
LSPPKLTPCSCWHRPYGVRTGESAVHRGLNQGHVRLVCFAVGGAKAEGAIKYQSLEQKALLADVHPGIAMSRRERLEHWAELLERQRSRRLSTIEGTEFGSPREREGKRADSSPLTVAFEDPILRVEGLRGDRVGDADGTAR